MFRKISEGDVYLHNKEGFSVSGSRTALLPGGRLICSFNAESGSGVNDFVPMVCYSDNGTEWSEARVLWPELVGKKSISASVRNTADGRVCLAGIAFDIACAGENWWSNELGAMKDNYIVYSFSDDGITFTDPVFVKPLPGEACENPGGMLVSKDGSFHAVYSPYPTVEAPGKADTCRLCVMHSYDNGKTFTCESAGETGAPSQYAEAWIVELSGGKKVIGAWQTADPVHSDKYLLEGDNGKFGPVRDLPFSGQSLALTPTKDNGLIIVYNQRKEKDPGVWAAYLTGENGELVLKENRPVWLASSTTKSSSSGDFSEWTDFSFGEPQLTVLPDGNLLTVLWYDQGSSTGIHYVITDGI